MKLPPILLLALAAPAAALRQPPPARLDKARGGSRRAVLGTALAFAPLAAQALPSFEKEGIEGLRPETVKVRMKPDGFGGMVPRDEPVKSVAARALDVVVSDDGAPSAPAPKAAPKAAPAAAASSSKSSAPKLTLDEMVENSIAQKEALLGRPLDTAERADITAKLKSLLGA